MRDNVCTYCGVEGHRASHCPRRAQLDGWPWSFKDFVAVIVMAAVIVGGACCA